MDVENIRKKRDVRAFDVNINYYKRSFVQKYINYFAPKYYNSVSLHIKKTL